MASVRNVIILGPVELAQRITENDYETIANVLFCLAQRLRGKTVHVLDSNRLEKACINLVDASRFLDEIHKLNRLGTQ